MTGLAPTIGKREEGEVHVTGTSPSQQWKLNASERLRNKLIIAYVRNKSRGKLAFLQRNLGQHYIYIQPQGKEPGQRDTTNNDGRPGGIRQTPGHLQKQPCHLPEETGVQLLRAASYDIIWCRDLDTDQTSTEQTCSRTNQNGKKYAQHHIQR